MKVVVNRERNGIWLSWPAILALNGLKEKEAVERVEKFYSAHNVEPYTLFDNDRSNPNLIKVIEKMGKDADDYAAKLEIVELLDGTEYEIIGSEFDRGESIKLVDSKNEETI